ncbi:MAG: hypothetical protein AYK18_13545 [Theionarchaea archaeon DG-70]|nr:MAG: hypothetical protein AYK18_13545 [Theionarchaea archaeon DG-70]
MHPYATDSNEKKHIPFILVTISIPFAWLLNKMFLSEMLNLTSFWWLEAPSVFGFYGLFYAVFDKYLWRTSIFRKIGMVKIPDLNGIWKGYISSSFDSLETKQDATVEVRQSWTGICISLKTDNSKSRSLTASILTKDQNAILISYEYLNEPKYSAKATMHTHRGTCRLILSSDRQELKGEYYTGRDRQNFGVLTFKRLSNGSYANSNEVNR